MGMSGAGSRVGAGVHRGELRLRIEGAFSAAQIKELAGKWGLETSPSWDGGAADAAHGLLKEAERRLGLIELVRRLKIERPLYEWPDLDEAGLEEWGPPSTGAPAGLDAGEATILDTPEEIRARGEAERAAAAADRPPASQGPSSKAPSPAPFPGTEVPRPPRQGIDPKILYGVVAGMLVVTGIAFAAGYLLTHGGNSEKGASPVAREHGPAKMAAGIFGTALAEVADRCDVELEGPATRDVLAFIQTNCGPGPAVTRKSPKRKPANDDVDVDVGDVRKRRPTPGDATKASADPTSSAGAPVPRTPGKPSCLPACASEHKACVSSCGPEPGDARQYDAWQGCNSRCLSSESRCRLACR